MIQNINSAFEERRLLELEREHIGILIQGDIYSRPMHEYIMLLFRLAYIENVVVYLDWLIAGELINLPLSFFEN